LRSTFAKNSCSICATFTNCTKERRAATKNTGSWRDRVIGIEAEEAEAGGQVEDEDEAEAEED